MSTVQELQASIEEYRTQILHVDRALANGSGAELESLQNLRSDLQELLDLTNETLHEQTGGAIGKNRDPDDDDDPLADEMSAFMREIREIDGSSQVAGGEPDNDVDDEDQLLAFNKLKTKLESMVGSKCLAPHRHTWGSDGYYNAMICGLDNVQVDGPIDEATVPVLVLFTNPTHQEMVPCSYFLDGDCRFDAAKCRFSHGESVAFGRLRAYSEPNFALLEKPNCRVLAKQKDRIWYKGRVVCCDFEASTCRVKLEHNKTEVDCLFADLLPQIGDGNQTSESESDDDTTSADDDTDDHALEIEAAARRDTQQYDNRPDPPIEWEKHTKGFGSRIMQKFGYVIGTGLGKNNEGIVQPVCAQILPVGRSLDHCMELREKANGDRDLFSVERRLKRNKRAQEQRNVKAYEREVRNNVDVFSFMNDTVFAGMSSGSGGGSQKGAAAPPTGVQPTKQDLKSHSNKNLNVTGYKIEQDIRKVEQEIYKLRESMTRHKCGTPIFDQLRRKLDDQTGTLNELKRSESNVAREQAFRKDKSKLTIF